MRWTESGLSVESVVIGDRGATGYGARYTLRCDEHWRTREVRLHYLRGPSMHVSADGAGNWVDEMRGGAPLPDLDGCLDVDIGVTPLTNTLPIKRLALQEGEARPICAAYVPLPSQVEDGRLIPRPAEQRYTCLAPGQRYRYEGLFRSFTAELEIDADGMVIDYPDTFRRV